MNLNLGSEDSLPSGIPIQRGDGNWPKSISDEGTYSKLEKKTRVKVREGIEIVETNII